MGGLLVCSAQAGGKERGRPIEFSEPRSDEVTTNLHQLTSKKDGLRQLEEDLYKPLQSFTPKSSLEGVVAPPPRPPAAPVIQSKRAKELLERRKNWVFMSPEDLLAGPTVEEILKSPQIRRRWPGEEGAAATGAVLPAPCHQAALGQTTRQSKDDDLFGTPGKSNSRDELAAHDDSNLPSGLRESAQALKQLSESDSGDNPFRPRLRRTAAFPTLSASANNTPSKEQMLEHKKFMDEYHSLVDPGWHPPAVATPGQSAHFRRRCGSPAGKPAAGLPSSPSPAPRTGLDAQMDIINPLLGPAGLPDVNAQALGQTRPAPALPTC